MKKILSLVIALVFCGSLFAQPPSIDAKEGMVFGKETSKKDAMDTKELATVVADGKEATIKVKGKVSEVCEAEGCWLRMETPTGSMMIRMKDHAFFVPVSLKDQKIVAEGTVTVKETSVDMLRHYAEDAGKSKAEIEAITEPKKEMVMMATGILVL